MPLPIEKAAKRDEKKKLGDADQVMVRVGELEEELAHLKSMYEQYFLGVERRPPTDAHERFKKGLKELKSHFVRHTGANFRVQGLQAKYLTYERLWQRTLQEIEAGTYKRDIFKAKRHQQQSQKKKKTNGEAVPNPDATPPEEDPLGAHPEDVPGGPVPGALRPPPPPPMLGDEDEDTPPPLPPMPPVPAPGARPGMPGITAAPALKPVAPGQPGSKPGIPAVGPGATSKPGIPAITAAPAVKPGAPAAGKPTITAARGESPSAPMARGAAPSANDGELSEKKIKAIYDAYVMAKKRCNEDTSRLSVDSLASTLRKQVPELMKQHGAKSVEFKVVIKDGKAVLRALPKT